MPTFDTPEPISVTIELGVGDVRITASDRTDTVVEVRPSDPTDEADVQAAEQTRVELRRRPAAGQGARRQRGLRLFGKPGSVDVHDRAAERARRCTATPSVGGTSAARPARRVPAQDRDRRHPARRDRPAATCDTGAGDIAVDRVERRRRDHHRLRHGPHRRDRRHRGGQELQRRHLDRRGHRRPAGERAPTATSPSTAPTPASTAKTANGDIRLGEVVRGSVVARDRARRARGRRPRRAPPPGSTSTPASASVRNDLDDDRRPRRADETVEVRARTSLRRHRRSAAPDASDRTANEETMTATDRPAIAVDRAAQVLRRQGRARRHRPDVAEGTVFALLGPNGAGKTTTVQILSTLIRADAGEVRVAGHDLAARARRGARRDRRHRPVLGGRQPAHRRGEPAPDGRPAPPRPGRGPAPRRRTARAVRPGRGGRQAGRRPTPAACAAGSTWR